MKLTFEMDPHNAKDVTTLSRISRALDWKDFPADEEGDEEAPYTVDEVPLGVDEPEAPVAESAPEKIEDKSHSAPEKPKRTRRSKAEIRAEKEAEAAETAGAPDPEPAKEEPKAEPPKEEPKVEPPKEEPKVEPPEPLGFGAPPPVDPKVLRGQLLDTMMALHKLYQAGNAAPINNVINAFRSKCTGGKFDNVNDVPDDLLPAVIAFADVQLRG